MSYRSSDEETEDVHIGYRTLAILDITVSETVAMIQRAVQRNRLQYKPAKFLATSGTSGNVSEQVHFKVKLT